MSGDSARPMYAGEVCPMYAGEVCSMMESDELDDLLEIETMLADVLSAFEQVVPSLPDHVRQAVTLHNEATDRLRIFLVEAAKKDALAPPATGAAAKRCQARWGGEGGSQCKYEQGHKGLHSCS